MTSGHGLRLLCTSARFLLTSRQAHHIRPVQSCACQPADLSIAHTCSGESASVSSSTSTASAAPSVEDGRSSQPAVSAPITTSAMALSRCCAACQYLSVSTLRAPETRGRSRRCMAGSSQLHRAAPPPARPELSPAGRMWADRSHCMVIRAGGKQQPTPLRDGCSKSERAASTTYELLREAYWLRVKGGIRVSVSVKFRVRVTQLG